MYDEATRQNKTTTASLLLCNRKKDESRRYETGTEQGIEQGRVVKEKK